jgi:hypothetical protein
VALAFSTIFLLTVAIACWVYYSQAPAVDFASFWAAGRLAMQGAPSLAYDIAVHRSVEMSVAHMGGLMPFPYPPPFLFVVAAIAFHPFWLAYLAWISVTAALYFAAAVQLTPARYVFSHPAAVVNAIIGQNGLLTSAIFIFGLSLLATQPFVGGAVLGLLVMKPQLGVLLPVAFLASRQWRAIAGAAVSSLVLLALAGLVFGPDSYRAFFAMSGKYAGFMELSRWKWSEFASVFAFFRFFGVPQPIALGLQGIAALAAAVLTWRAWAAQAEHRGAILAASTLLVPPYLLTYDSVLLIVPLAALLRDPGRPWRVAAVWLCLLAPVLSYFGLYPGPSTIPLAAGLSIYWLSPSLDKRKAAAPFDAAAS